MKFVLSISILFASLSSFAGEITTYEKCYKERSSSIPTVEEREFLDAYIEYLKRGTKSNGEQAIQKMQTLAKKQGGQFSVKWVSVFEGAFELCCGAPQICNKSFGSVSLEGLMPRVKKGWVTATFFVQMYNKLAKSDGADASGLKAYMNVIKNEHPWAIHLFNKKYP